MRQWMRELSPVLVLVVILCCGGTGIASENITYDGADSIDWEENMLHRLGIGPNGTESGKSGSISNNTITIKNIQNVSPGAPAIPGGWNSVFAYGALNENDSGAVAGNTLIIENSRLYDGIDPLSGRPKGASLIAGAAGTSKYEPHDQAYSISSVANNNRLVVRDSAAAYAKGAEADQDYTYSIHDPANTDHIVNSTVVANNNTVEVYDDSTVHNIAGGDGSFTLDYWHAPDSPAGDDSFTINATQTANNNTVAINGGAMDRITGGSAETDIYHSESEPEFSGFISGVLSAIAKGNTVTLEGGTVKQAVIGGEAYIGAYGFKKIDVAAAAEATDNTVVITGGKIIGVVIGGMAVSEIGGSKAIRNTVTVGGNADLSNASIFGGETVAAYAANASDLFTGNTLIKNSAAAVRDVHNFEFIRFGYSGDANIDDIDLSGGEVKLDTGSRSIAYDGTFSGTGSLTKIGSGVLAFGGNMSLGGKMTVREGTLSISESLSIAAGGGLFFGEGSEFTPNGNKLSVNGGVGIDSGARINISDIDVGNTVLASDRAIAGSFNLDSWFYKTAFSDDRKEFSVIGEFSADEKGGNIVAALANSGVTTGKNDVKGMGQLMSMLDSVGPEVEKELIRQLEGYVALADRGDTSAAAVGVQQILGRHSVRAARATRAVARSFGGAVSGHLAHMRDYRMAMNDAPSARSNRAYASLPGSRRLSAARGDNGYAAMANRIWAGGFGSFAHQKDDDGEFGYDYNSGGFILGYDHRFGDRLTVGLSGAYSRGKIDGNDGRSETDVDTMNLGVYASYDTPGGFYADANLGFGFTWNEEDERLVLGGRRSGRFKTSSFQLGGNAGYVFRLPSAFRLVPTIGLQYIHVRQGGYEQSGDALAMWRDASSANYLEIPIAMRVNRTFELGGGVSVTPELRAAWIIEAKQDDASVRTGFAGNRNASMLVSGTNPGKHRGLVGAGMKFRMGERVDAFLNYNLEFRKRYTNHNLMAGVGVSF